MDASEPKEGSGSVTEGLVASAASETFAWPSPEELIPFLFNFQKDETCAVYVFGRVYGTATPESDWDFIVVVKDAVAGKYGIGEEVSHRLSNEAPLNSGTSIKGTASATSCVPFVKSWDTIVYTASDFTAKLAGHYLPALECFFLPSHLVLYRDPAFEPKWSLDVGTLRSSISAESDLSFVRSKQKLIVQKDFNPKKAKKALFHAFRTIEFGIQLAKEGKIARFDSMNKFWESELKNNASVEWAFYKAKFSAPYRKLKTQFKLAAPKPGTPGTK